MIKVSKFSLRNLFRNKRRSLLTMLVIVVSFFVLSIFQGYINSQRIGWRDLMIHNDYGHLQIFHQQYDKDDNASFSTMISSDIYKALSSVLKENASVQYFSPRLALSGLIGNENGSKIFIGSARDPSESKELYYFEIAKEGDALSDKTPRGILIGQKLAAKLKSKIGDRVLLMSNSVYGSIEAIDAEIVGFSKTYSQLDSMGVFLRIQDAEDLLLTDSYHSVVVLLKKEANERKVIADLNQMFKEKNQPLKALSFEDIATFFVQIVQMYENYFRVSIIVLSILIVFSLTNTIFMAVIERTKEFSVMKTIGISSKTIFISILLEGVFIALFSVVIGAILAYFGHLIINTIGLTLPPPPGSEDRIPFSVIFSMGENFKIGFVLVIVSLAAGIIPAFRVLRLDIIKGLKDD